MLIGRMTYKIRGEKKECLVRFNSTGSRFRGGDVSWQYRDPNLFFAGKWVLLRDSAGGVFPR